MAGMDMRPLFAEEAAARAAVTIRVAAPADLPEVLRVQHAAFTRVACGAGIDPQAMSPVRETLEDLQRLLETGMRTLVALCEDRVVGTVRGALTHTGTLEVGRLGVDDGFEKRGIGAALMLSLEHEFPQATRYELYTAKQATGPIRLYESLGYRIFRERSQPDWDMVWLEKVPAGPAPTAPADAPLH
jgi:ribosomal protein S18 acetylase RimI-like enzyme